MKKAAPVKGAAIKVNAGPTKAYRQESAGM